MKYNLLKSSEEQKSEFPYLCEHNYFEFFNSTIAIKTTRKKNCE